MAAFDRSNGHIVVRVVYDGPSGAGKTENLKQLVHTFSTQRRGDLSSPRSAESTTSYFDWLVFNGGIVDGHALRAQLVTVPGRSVLTRRRWQLVRDADVIVFVCESTPRGLKEATRWLELLRAHLAASGLAPTLVVQANQQDREDAVPPEEVARALGVPAGTDVLGAIATKATGVRETVVHAIRAAAALAQREILERGVDGLRDADDEARLLAVLDGSAALGRVLELRDDVLPPFPQEDVPSGYVWPGTNGRSVLRALGRALAAERIERVDGAPSRVALRVGGFVLETTRERAAADAATARSVLLEAARARVRSSAAGEATLVLATRDDGSTWLWTVTPAPGTERERSATSHALPEQA